MISTRTPVLFFALLLSIAAIGQQTWYQLDEMPGIGRHHPICFSIDGKGYMVCGNADGNQTAEPYLNDFYTYDPDSDEWTQLEDFPGSPRGFGVGLTYEGKGYIGFGYGSNMYLDDLWEYDPETEEWTQLPSCPCDGRTHPAFVAARGKLYVGLGGTGRNAGDWWSYNIENKIWVQEQAFPAERRHHPYYFSVGETPYVGFGHSGPPTEIHNDFYKFDPVLRTWIKMNDFPSHGRVAGTHFAYNNKGYILAGDGADHGYDEGEFWEYDPVNDSWLQLPTFPEDGRWAPGCFEIDGTVYFTSGFARNTRVYHSDLWGYDLRISTSTKDEAASLIDIAPNPAADKVTISGTEVDDQLTLLNLQGQELQAFRGESGKTELRISSLQSGVYMIKVERGEKLISTKRMLKY